jgi:hypothetical protein
VLLHILSEEFGVASRLDPAFPNFFILSQGNDEIAIPIFPPSHTAFDPIVVTRALKRFEINESEFRDAYNAFYRAA